MADEPKKPGIFSKAAEAAYTYLDSYIQKSKSPIPQKPFEVEEDEGYYRKAAYQDQDYTIGSQGYKEKTSRLSFTLLHEMSRKNSIVSAIVSTRQNQVAAFTKPTKEHYQQGFKIALKQERQELNKIKDELRGSQSEEHDFLDNSDIDDEVKKAIKVDADNERNMLESSDDDDKAISERELERKARKILSEKTAKKVAELESFVLNCGRTEDRPFESKKWTFDGILRALIRDSLTYDQYCVEKIPDREGNLHHFLPTDASTIRFSSPELANYKKYEVDNGYSLLYPEQEIKALERNDALDLDPKKLEDNSYKFVQVIRGRIVRAFTEREMAMGIRNPQTNIYANGYSLSELETLLTQVTAHLNTENFNRSYHTQGFSAKGILHIKSPLSRRKLESLRIEWKHLVSGNRNSFQTPIISGVDEVKWIPLNQNHTDMEFQNWNNYLIKTICAGYQIDPLEIGFGMREEGGKVGGLAGDNSKVKLEFSKDKGLVPLLRNIEDFINKYIIAEIAPEYELRFVGIEEENLAEAVERQLKEVKFKKTVNEIREEANLLPIDGMDEIILDPNFLEAYSLFNPHGQKMAKEAAADQNKQQMLHEGQLASPKDTSKLEGKNSDDTDAFSTDVPDGGIDDMAKSLKKAQIVTIEHYTIKGD